MLSCGFPKISVIFLFISYFFDCLDGFYARSYGMVTVFGDYYDHITDWLINTGYMWVLCRYKEFSVVVGVACILVPLLAIQMIHLSAVEKYYDNPKESQSLIFIKKIINNIDSRKKSVKYLNWSKYFGCGTYYMVLILITLIVY
jgi:phosphatidylglycerophosphate synthase